MDWKCEANFFPRKNLHFFFSSKNSLFYKVLFSDLSFEYNLEIGVYLINLQIIFSWKRCLQLAHRIVAWFSLARYHHFFRICTMYWKYVIYKIYWNIFFNFFRQLWRQTVKVESQILVSQIFWHQKILHIPFLKVRNVPLKNRTSSW